MNGVTNPSDQSQQTVKQMNGLWRARLDGGSWAPVSLDYQSKKTVSPLPCSTTFHSSVFSAPGARVAIMVERLSAGTSCNSGSSALLGSPGKYIRVSNCLSSPRANIVTTTCGAWRF